MGRLRRLYTHMRTLLFCTSYAETVANWDERWGRWLKSNLNSGIKADQILIVDDGSPIVPTWPDIPVVAAEQPHDLDARVLIHHFADRRGRLVGGEPFPGWYRSFAHAIIYGILHQFDKIIHIEADAYLISDNAIDFFNQCSRGWIGLWCGRHNWPESTFQIINRDQFDTALAFFSKPYSAHLGEPYRPIETLIPYTQVYRSLIGDRYGEDGDSIPFGADYVSQVRWNMGPDYYWWMSENGIRKDKRMLTSDLTNLIRTYERTPTPAPPHSGIDYREFLRFINNKMVPRSYLEIGTHQGESAETTSCDAILIDPQFAIANNIVGRRKRTYLFQMPSDDFFDRHDPRDLVGDVDLGFLDGLHHFEALLRDFINFERHSHRGSMALLHDCLPLNTRMAGRLHTAGPETESIDTRAFWTGDVWRILPILQEFRPDLTVLLLDCPPTGLVLCSGLNCRSTTLMYKFDEVVRRYAAVSLEEYGLDKLWRTFPIMDSRKIVSDPMAFCEYFQFRR